MSNNDEDTNTMDRSKEMEHGSLEREKSQSRRGSLARAWSSRRQESPSEETAGRRRLSVFASTRRMVPEEEILDLSEMADFEEADADERGDSIGHVFVVQEKGGAEEPVDDTEEGTAKLEYDHEGTPISTESIGSHLLTQNIFVLEVASNRSIRFAIYLVYLVFTAAIVLELLNAFGDPASSTAIAIRLANSTGPLCSPYPNGTCASYDAVSATEAALLSNTGVVSDGLNATDWEGTGASSNAPPFTAHDLMFGVFMSDPTVLEYSANPQLHEYWEDVTAMLWIGYRGNPKSDLRVIHLDLEFERADGTDWPSSMEDEPFPVRIEGYACVRGKNCDNVGDWRLMVRDDEPFFPIRSVNGNKYKARLTVYSHYLGEEIIDSLGWRISIFADPEGAVSGALAVNESTDVILTKYVISGDPDLPTTVAIVNTVVMAIFVVFFLWWCYVLRTKGGPFSQWATENKWLLFSSIGFIISLSPIIVGLQLYMTTNDGAPFNEQWWCAGWIVSGFGQSILWFVFACFSDSPRRYVTTKLRFYGFKTLFGAIYCATNAVAQTYRFPSVTGRDEPGTESELGGVGYVTAPENWSRRDERVFAVLMSIIIIQILFAFIYYAYANARSRRVLKYLPYSMTRPIQLSSRFFLWVTSLWVLVEFILTIVNIVQVIEQDQDYYAHMDGLSRYVIALDSMDLVAGSFNGIYGQIFGLVFFIIFQSFFLPPDAFGGLVRKAKTHYVSEQEADQDGIQGRPKFLMVLDLTKLLMVCSKEVYLPFEGELEGRVKSTRVKDSSMEENYSFTNSAAKAFSTANRTFRTLESDEAKNVVMDVEEQQETVQSVPDDKVTTNAMLSSSKLEVRSISIAKGTFEPLKTESTEVTEEAVLVNDPERAVSTMQSETPPENDEPDTPNVAVDGVENTMADELECVKDPERAVSTMQSETPPENDEPDTPSVAVDRVANAMADERECATSPVHGESPTADVEAETPEMRLAGASGSAPGFLPWESTYAMGCTVVARLAEPEETDMHNTRAIILRHRESGDLIVSFRGTLTKKQVKTDLMSSKILVDLDTFLTTCAPKRCTQVSDVRDDVAMLSPDVVEAKIRSGEIRKIRLMDLLDKQEHGELPDYLQSAVKVSDEIEGTCKIHFGFWSSYNRIRRQVHLTVREELLARPGRLLITGHSLGGAQATLCAYDLSRWGLLTIRKELMKTGGRGLADKVKLGCYNFGSPRVGDAAFKAAYNKMVLNMQRVVNDGDVVTGVPPARLGFRHVGRENIFDRVGSIRVDPSLIEKEFTQPKTAVNPHKMDSYRDVVMKSFNPIMSEEQLLGLIRTAYGYD